MCLPNEQIVDAFVLMAAGYQDGLVNQWMEGIGDPCFERQKPGIMNPARMKGAAIGPGLPA